MKLNLGCGRNTLSGWVNIDSARLPGVDIVADLDACRHSFLPFRDDSFDEFHGSHVMEHLNNTLSFMQELHRISRKGANAVFRVPYGSSDDAFEDPTHVRRYFMNSFAYFSQPAYSRADYGYRGDWATNKITLHVDRNRHSGKKVEDIMHEIKTFRNIVLEMVVELRCIKPIRQPERELYSPPNIEISLS
jgi:SAM-dependent methyltransferase